MASKPERAVRAALLRLGARFDCNVDGLPGRPDVVLPDHRAVFVNGCVWHGCGCRPAPDAWKDQIAQTVARDRTVASALKQSGWRLLVLWEHETRNFDALTERLQAFLNA